MPIVTIGSMITILHPAGIQRPEVACFEAPNDTKDLIDAKHHTNRLMGNGGDRSSEDDVVISEVVVQLGGCGRATKASGYKGQ